LEQELADPNPSVGDPSFDHAEPGGTMNEARIAGFLGRRPARKPARILPATCWDGTLNAPVEIAVPDRESAGMLLNEVGLGFQAELVEGSGSAAVVRLHPAASGPAGWVFEVLALVERWLEARRLPVANVRHEGRTYVIAAPTPDRQRPGDGDLHSAA
jgi:hypothetical protein